MKCVILAGGFGKRLRPLTDEKPKPMIEVSGLPILAWQLRWMKGHGINEAILCTGYMKESIIGYIGSGSRFGVKVGYAVEEEPLGTGGALKNAEALLSGEESFVVLNGDVITSLNPLILRDALKDDLVATVAVVPLRSPFGIVDIENDYYVRGFREKPQLKEYWINAGVYTLSHEIFRYLPENGSIETEAFPILAKKRKLKAVPFEDAMWRSIDSHKDIEEADRELKHVKS